MYVMLMIIGGVMAIAGLVGLRNGLSWARPVAVLGSLMAVAAAVLRLTLPPAPEIDWRGTFLVAYEMSGQVAGEVIARDYAKETVAIVTRPAARSDYALNEYEKARIRGLERGLGDMPAVRVSIPWDADMTNQYPDEAAYQHMMTASMLRAHLNKLCPDATLVVLASDFTGVWADPQSLRGGLKYIAFDLDRDVALRMLYEGSLLFSVVRNEDDVDFTALPADPLAAFNAQYEILTR